MLTVLFSSLLAPSAAGALNPDRYKRDTGEQANKDALSLATAKLDELSESIILKRLSNGLRVLFYKRGTAPVFSGAVLVRVGGSDEEVGHTGVSHLFEHMAFKGNQEVGVTDYRRESKLLAELEEIMARSWPDGSISSEDQPRWDAIHEELKTLWVPEAFTREYEKQGATGLNATTNSELTRYFVSLPRSAFEWFCYFESERLLRPVMRQFYQERDVVMEERRMRYDNDPGGKLYETLLSSAFRRHPYRNPVIGYPADLQRLTASFAEQFRKRYYVPSNIVVALVGDVDVVSDMKLIEAYFGRIPPAPPPPRPEIVEEYQTSEQATAIEFNAQPQVMLAYKKPAYPDPDDVKISLLSEMLAGSRLSPLYRQLVLEKRLASSLSHFEAPGYSYPNLLVFSMLPKAPHTNRELLQAFDKIIADTKRSGFDAALIDVSKRSLAVSTLNEFRSSMSIALLFGGAELLYDDWQVPIKWFKELVEVTDDEVMQMFHKYLVPSRRTIVQLEPSQGESSEQQQ